MRRTPRVVPAVVFLLLLPLLDGCGWIAEQRARRGRAKAETALVDAVDSGSVKTVRDILEDDRTLANAVRLVRWKTSRRTDSALTLAVRKGRQDIVLLLFEFGANPNMADGTGTMPLTAALMADGDRGPMLTLLLENGADPAAAGERGSSALHQAVTRTGSEEAATLQLLVAKASGPGAPDARGWTPLHAAASSSNTLAIRLLVAKGTDPNALSMVAKPLAGMPADVAGSTPLALVALDRQIAAAAALCALGADPDVTDASGASARQIAARVAAAEGAKSNDAADPDVARHRNMAAFLAPGAGCDALLKRRRAGESIPEAEVGRIANESECAAGWGGPCGLAAWTYYRGEGVAADASKAFALFRKGCADVLTRSEWACGMAGVFYVEGTAVPRDPAEGARWLSKGCETSNPNRSDEQACDRLGLLYAEGTGVPRDLVKARSLFKRACDGKYAPACADLVTYAGN